MKKAYKTPAAKVFEQQAEDCILSSSLPTNNSGAELTDDSWLSNKKSTWSSSNWSKTGD